MADKQRQTKTAEQAETQPSGETYFFPNTDEGAPFSCQASSREEAEKQNATHVKQQKENS